MHRSIEFSPSEWQTTKDLLEEMQKIFLKMPIEL